MGKDLRGKELGVGITQRKDGLYQGRYKDSSARARQFTTASCQNCGKNLVKQ